jgi:Animal haem peroxidase
MAASPFAKAFTASMEALDRKVGWHRVPLVLGLGVLLGLRLRLQEKNLYDTRAPQPETGANGSGSGRPAWDARYATARTLDGTYNSLDDPLMGSAGSRFGRNVPPEYTYPETLPQLMEPNPRTVSRELLTRETFLPATTLNVLAAAWIQFEVHDWVFHGKQPEDNPWQVDLAKDDPWAECPMRINRTRPDPQPDANGGPATWVNTETHWWDTSHVYGETESDARALRTGEHGKLRMDDRGLVPAELEQNLDYSLVPGAFWVGLSILHSLFMREHNAVCDHLHTRYPELSDDDLYEKARLVICALIAKIHTLEWTCAVINHPTTVHALKGNWWGLVGEQFDKKFGRITSNEVVRGLVGAPTNLHGVPYSLTEEFVSVYRMHPLIPDDYSFRSLRTDEVLQERTFHELGALALRQRLDEMEMDDVFYSLGTEHPGEITLHNFPRFLQKFERADGNTLDLAAIDVLRVRERGVPRYNQFRRLFHMNPVRTFDELTDRREWVDQLRRVYDNDIEAVDLMIGMFAEPKPRGFGFSDTAFRVFVLMASRRIEADRFFTVDYRPEVYTRAGIDWVENNTMKSVLLRHFPALEPRLRGVENAFAPWPRAGS